MPAVDPLEYLEEDESSNLFGSSPEPDPLDAPGPSRRPLPYLPPQPRLPITTPDTTRQVGQTRQSRLEELRKRKAPFVEIHPSHGAASLQTFCMSVIKANSSRIYDIGDLEYHVVRGFIDHLPMEQLSEVESNSKHIRKDTDWLWEIFLLTDFPLFHERCNSRQGQQRDRGWRRMYKKAIEDQAERQQAAMAKVAERYKQLESERASKKLVMVEKLATTQRGARRGAAAGRSGGLPSIPGPRRLAEPKTTASAVPKATSALAKARVDAQRARVAMTHASGRFIPQPVKPPRRKGGTNELFSKPYLAPSHTPTSTSTISPLAKPRAEPLPGSQSPIPGSYPTSQSAAVRAALPAHLASSSAASSPDEGASQRASATDRLLSESSKRFRVPDEPSSKLVPIKRARIENFEPPKPNRPIVDFFGDSPASIPQQDKRKEADAVDSDDTNRGEIGGSPGKPRLTPTPGIHRPAAGSKEENEKLAGVLFRKKKPRVSA
ncbi:RNA polymerase II transcription factor SIII subunit A-domain-containing protein [Naematelia encephala]|uniref:RNA polymerase II transcription factor SIII subunit A-domain-containing protein n=1 Tax=Naematelia encephala TaxID=71784 RepID=A0A1Y2B4Q9_9TREE|nr:RNA polymerase II transcription factor SIII subunit A-domain-containing protein [Naematelia encephala]